MSETQTENPEELFVPLSNPAGGNRPFSRRQLVGDIIQPANPEDDNNTRRFDNHIRPVYEEHPELRAESDAHGEYWILSATDGVDGMKREQHQSLLNTQREVAQDSLAWIQRLESYHDSSPLRRLGRGVINACGVRTATQRSIERHQAMISDYEKSLGVEPKADRFVSAEDHIRYRDKTVSGRFSENLRTYIDGLVRDADENSQAFIDYLLTKLDVDSIEDASDEALVAAYDHYMRDVDVRLPGDDTTENPSGRSLVASEAIAEKKVEDSRQELDEYVDKLKRKIKAIKAQSPVELLFDAQRRKTAREKQELEKAKELLAFVRQNTKL